jgi:anti-anti-sigma factor
VSPLHELQVVEEGGALVAHVDGEVDSSNAGEVGRTLRERAEGRRLVLDLRDTEYLDSAGIAMLDALRRVTDLRVVLTTQSIVGRALMIAGFAQLVSVFDTVDQAIAAPK